jgi:hypothetical protein
MSTVTDNHGEQVARLTLLLRVVVIVLVSAGCLTVAYFNGRITDALSGVGDVAFYLGGAIIFGVCLYGFRVLDKRSSGTSTKRAASRRRP